MDNLIRAALNRLPFTLLDESFVYARRGERIPVENPPEDIEGFVANNNGIYRIMKTYRGKEFAGDRPVYMCPVDDFPDYIEDRRLSVGLELKVIEDAVTLMHADAALNSYIKSSSPKRSVGFKR